MAGWGLPPVCDITRLRLRARASYFLSFCALRKLRLKIGFSFCRHKRGESRNNEAKPYEKIIFGNARYGVATLVGTIVGVGIFGLPYAASRAGFFTQLFIWACLRECSCCFILCSVRSCRAPHSGIGCGVCGRVFGGSGKKIH